MTNEVLHLVLGDTAAGVLREAMSAGSPAPAPLLRFRDIYCLGPLDRLGTSDGAASRAAYWRQLFPDAPPTVAEFEEEEARYVNARERAATGTLLLWVGAHSSSQLWLQRLCSMLPSQPADVRIIRVTGAGAGGRDRRALGQFEPREVSGLLAQARPLGDDEIAHLALDWQTNATVASGVRRWVEDRIRHHADDFYDALLLTQCDDDWQPAEQVIGSAMWDCDEFLGDVFFAWRLRCLAQAGRVQWRGPVGRLAEAVVSLPGWGSAAGTRH